MAMVRAVGLKPIVRGLIVAVAVTVSGCATPTASTAPTPRIGTASDLASISPPPSASAAVAAASPTAQSTATPYPMPTGAPLTWITPSPSVTCTEDTANGKLLYQSGARSYSGNMFRPAGSGPFPAMLVLHTSAGLGEHELAYGRWLADQGYVALAPDYFTPVSVTRQSFDPNTLQADAVREDLARAIDCLRSLAYVDKARVGAVGFSLGGYFALALGTRADVRAVIGYYAGVCKPADDLCPARYPTATVAAQMRAPVLLLHGDADTTVPFAFIRATQDILMGAGKISQLVPYAGVQHAFDFGSRASNPGYDARATADAQARSLAFLQATVR